MKANLTDVISKIRDELVSLDAKRREQGREALFELTEAEIEINFVVETSDAIKGGFDLKVISLGTEDHYKGKEIQKIKIKLSPATNENQLAPLGSRFRTEKPSSTELRKEDVERL